MWLDPEITQISLAPSRSLTLCRFERTENLNFVCSIGNSLSETYVQKHEELIFGYTNR